MYHSAKFLFYRGGMPYYEAARVTDVPNSGNRGYKKVKSTEEVMDVLRF